MSDLLTKDILFRGQILAYSLLIESLTSIFLARLVGIKNHADSKTLGNKSSSLSFNQKIDFLLDLQVLTSEEKKKAQTFMEIRNQLMHNLSASTYEKCFGNLQGKEKWILSQYPPDVKLSKEEQLKKASISLSNEVYNIIIRVHDSIIAKEEKEKELSSVKRKLAARDKVNNEVEGLVVELLENKLGTNIPAELKGIEKEISIEILRRIKKYWYELLEEVKAEHRKVI